MSTREGQQVFDRQVDALRAAGCARIYDDRGSGASTERPGLKACLDYLRRGDVLVVPDLDRLGRLAGELTRLVDELEAKGVGFRALNAVFDTKTPMDRAFLQSQAAFAEMERYVIRQRVKEGIAAARARGRKGGRPRLITPERLCYAHHLMADRERSVPASTLYHYLHANGTLKALRARLLGAAPAGGLQRDGMATQGAQGGSNLP